jgi:NDP-sugar pyrophosphorylase family protein
MKAQDPAGIRPEDLFDLDGFEHCQLFDEVDCVWEVLPRIEAHIRRRLTPNCEEVRKRGDVLARTVVLHGGQILYEGFEVIQGDASKGGLRVIHEGHGLRGASVIYSGASLLDDQIEIGEGVVVEPGALIRGPTIIGPNSEVRQGAYLRGACLVGEGCVVGHATEMKNAVMLDGAKAGHFAYIGDSLLGRDINLGAGTKLANLKIISGGVTVRVGDRTWPTGLRKFGAILGDRSETGCNSVTSPGTILGKDSLVYPCVGVEGGYYPPRTIISPGKGVVRVKRRSPRRG